MPPEDFTILVVDDSEDILLLIDTTLRKDYRVKLAQDGRSALRAAFEKPRPDLIMLDVEMPGASGYDVCKAIKASPALADVPVIFLTQRTGAEDVMQGFQLGAIDYLNKPINPPVLAARVRAHVELIRRRNEQEELIRERTQQLEQTRQQLIRRLGRAMEYHETSAVGNRVVRLGHYARHLAEAAGAKPALCDLLMKAAPLHDIGKIGVPAQVLRKAGQLTAPEREQMLRHPEIGAEIIGEHDDPLLKLARTLALTHHERWDGGGYPSGAAGTDIPWAGRIMAVVDAFESMTATQFHREPMPFELAVDEIVRGSGKQFDPQVVEAFRKALPQFRKVRESYADALGDMLDLDFVASPPATAPAAAELSAVEARATQATIAADEARAKAMAGAQARLKVDRDLAAAAVKDFAAQRAAQKRAEDAASREAEAAALARQRSTEEAVAARAAQERARAEAAAAQAARQASQANAQAAAQADERAKAEAALAAAAVERRKAEEEKARTAAELAAAAARATEAAKARAAEEAAARRAAEERAQAEAEAAGKSRQADSAQAEAEAEAQARVASEQALEAKAARLAEVESEAAALASTRLEAERAAAESQQRRAAQEEAAKLAAQARADAEAALLAQAQARVLAEKARADAAAERLRLEEEARRKAAEVAATQAKAVELARQADLAEEKAAEAARQRMAAQAEAERSGAEHARLQTARSDRAREWANVGGGKDSAAAAPARRSRSPIHAAIVVAVAVSAAAFYAELQSPRLPPRPQVKLEQKAPPPAARITPAPSKPIAELVQGAPLALRLDVNLGAMTTRSGGR
ncbi:MAG: HD domain-containing phosphohydrolase [Burkholderiales bacterium]